MHDDAVAIEVMLVKVQGVDSSKASKWMCELPEEYTQDALAKFGWPTGANPIPCFLVKRNVET